MKRVSRCLIVALLALALQHSVFCASTYVVVDQAIDQTLTESRRDGAAYAENLKESASILDVEIVILPAEPTQIIAMTQDEKREPDFFKVSDIVASPNAMVRQLVELFRTLPRGSTIFKIGREDAAWNEIRPRIHCLSCCSMAWAYGARWARFSYACCMH